MEEVFNLSISAKSNDVSKAIRCETRIEIMCSNDMAVSIMANLIQENEDLKTIFSEALVRVMTDPVNIQKITPDEYNDVKREPEL
jgi:hypothetical protein